MTGKSRYSGTRLAESSRRLLETRLPPGWSAVLPGPGPGGPGECPLELRSPDKKVARLDLRCRSQVFPREVIDLKEKRRTATVLVAPFLSVATQRRLRELGLNYLDLTGNVRLAVGRPGLFIETAGATKDPAPAPDTRRSLKGPKAGRLVRTLCEFPPPFTLSELATRAAIDGGYASRLVTWLAREDLLTRRAPDQSARLTSSDSSGDGPMTTRSSVPTSSPRFWMRAASRTSPSDSPNWA